jgi:hypothetical protein
MSDAEPARKQQSWQICLTWLTRKGALRFQYKLQEKVTFISLAV